MIIVVVGILCSLFFVKADAVNDHRADPGKEQHTVRYVEEADLLYRQIDFGDEQPLGREVFEQAYQGYLNLKAAGKIGPGKDMLSVCDFSLSANQKRLWVIDLNSKKLRYHSLVAHGQGTGEEFARHFSNRDGSHQSSLGFYITGDTYTGNNGYSLRLEGMDHDYNDRAYERAIVMHGADYVCPDFISDHKRLGRSWGCPAVPVALARPIINTIKGGTCLYIYYPDTRYLASSKWLNNSQNLLRDGFIPIQENDSSKMTMTRRRSGMLADASLSPGDAMSQEQQETLYQGVHLDTGHTME